MHMLRYLSPTLKPEPEPKDVQDAESKGSESKASETGTSNIADGVVVHKSALKQPETPVAKRVRFCL